MPLLLLNGSVLLMKTEMSSRQQKENCSEKNMNSIGKTCNIFVGSRVSVHVSYFLVATLLPLISKK
jgi:hypothetical protein